MVKFGKEYRKLQLDEWKKYYIDYKALKKKIKEIKTKIFGKRQQENAKTRQTRSSILSLPLLPEGQEDEGNLSTLYKEKNGELLKEFIELLLKEFKKSYSFFTGIEKVLIKKINTHLYTQTSYSTYGLVELSKEMKSLSLTVYLAKSLNGFINDIMMAVKKILKKFDKKFGCVFGLITPNLILSLLSKKNSELEYLLQFKIIDEVSTIAESNTYELKKYFDQNNEKSSKENDKFREDFLTKFEDTLGYIKDIDELIYFKTQYKDWLDYIRGIKNTKKNIKNLENDIFNPILSSSYYNDNLLDKFLSTKEAHKDVAMAQNPISKENKINIILVIIQTFFSSSLISCIFPLLYYFEYLNAYQISCKDIHKCSATISETLLIGVFIFIIVGAFYIGIFISAFIFYNYCATKRIKLSYTISYILSFFGSALYSISIIEEEGHFKKRGIILGVARALIGLGINPMIGKKYISIFAPKYNLPTISKIYLVFEILGMSLGPVFAALCTYIKFGKIICVFNCIGWYGAIGSLILLILHIFLFEQPIIGKFCIVKNQKNLDVNTSATQVSNQPFFEDVEDSQDKEFYKMQKEALERKKKGLEPTKSDDVKIETNDNINTPIGKTKSNIDKEEGTNSNVDADNVKQIIGEAGDVLGSDPSENYYNNVDTGRYSNLELNEEEQRDTIKNIEAKLYEYQEKSNFTYINMMPRTIDDIVLKEQKMFGYMNRNLMMMFLLLFFNNIIKENYIIFSSYFLLFDEDSYKSITEPKDYKNKTQNEFILEFANDNLTQLRFVCYYVSIELIFQLPSLLFIMPFYKVNLIYKKNLIIYMIASVIFMTSLSFVHQYYVYVPVVTIIIAINKVIEVTSSCYLVYLIPPQWKFMHLKAGRLPLYLMLFAKLLGCILCLTSFHPAGVTVNQYIINLIAVFAYGIIGAFIYKSKNFRVKALSRVLRKRIVE